MGYCLLELPTPFLSDLQARFGMFRALLQNHFASTWTMAKISHASLKLAFQEQFCPDRHAKQTCAVVVPAASFDDSTVDNKSRLAVAVTIVSAVVLGEGCNRQKGLLFKLHCWQPAKELKRRIGDEWVVYAHTSPQPLCRHMDNGKNFTSFCLRLAWT